MAEAFLFVQGPPTDGDAHSPLLLLTTEDADFEVVGDDSISIMTGNTDADIPRRLLLESGNAYTLVIRVAGGEEQRLSFKTQTAFEPHRGYVARSCDSIRVDPDRRQQIIDKLGSVMGREGGNLPLLTIGDAIYADHGFVQPLVGTTLDEYTHQYASAWVQTHYPLRHITASCVNFWVADDHEVWDNYRVSDLESNPHMMAGYTLLSRMYVVLMSGFRGTTMCRPDDDYTFMSGDTLFAVVASRGGGHGSVHGYTVPDPGEGVNLTIITPNAFMVKRPSTVFVFVSALTGDRLDMDREYPRDFFSQLATVKDTYKDTRVRVLAGDMHARMHETIRGIDVIVTSPFSNVSLGLTMHAPEWTAHQDLNFVEVHGDGVEFHSVEMPLYSVVYTLFTIGIVGARRLTIELLRSVQNYQGWPGNLAAWAIQKM